jgi:hypothetical protein
MTFIWFSTMTAAKTEPRCQLFLTCIRKVTISLGSQTKDNDTHFRSSISFVMLVYLLENIIVYRSYSLSIGTVHNTRSQNTSGQVFLRLHAQSVSKNYGNMVIRLGFTFMILILLCTHTLSKELLLVFSQIYILQFCF